MLNLISRQSNKKLQMKNSSSLANLIKKTSLYYHISKKNVLDNTTNLKIQMTGKPIHCNYSNSRMMSI